MKAVDEYFLLVVFMLFLLLLNKVHVWQELSICSLDE